MMLIAVRVVVTTMMVTKIPLAAAEAIAVTSVYSHPIKLVPLRFGLTFGDARAGPRTPNVAAFDRKPENLNHEP